jgi:hypothetical protein
LLRHAGIWVRVPAGTPACFFSSGLVG